GDQVHAVAQAAGGDVAQHRVELLELVAQRCPAVDDKEHVAVPVLRHGQRRVHIGRSAQPAERTNRVDAAGGEAAFPIREQRGYLTDRPAYLCGVQPASDAANVREVTQRSEGATAEVEAVDLDLLRSVGQRERGD